MIECVHCHQIGIMSFDGRSHWEVCPSHPARKRIAELEAENAKLKDGMDQARADAISNLKRLISVEAENARLKDGMYAAMEQKCEELTQRIFELESLLARFYWFHKVE